MGVREEVTMLQTPDKAKRRAMACATPPPAPARKAWQDVAQAPTPITPPRIATNARAHLRTPVSSPSPSRVESLQGSDSAEYLARLFRIARRQSTSRAPESPCAHRGRGPQQPAMADFLASFSMGGDAGPPIDSDKFGSVDELALHLRGLLEQKTTETRAEHCAVTLELRPTVQFHLSLTESENEAFEGLNNVDPSMGGVRSASMSVDPAGQATRSVSGNDALMNQSNNPILQRTVAKKIISVLGTTDNSNWTLRDLSRAEQGWWTFTYICTNSVQHWNRQHSKNTSSSVVGEYSQKEPDEILINRPAFDCRGSVTIAFNRSSRSISVKYDHTLLHKTVQQLSEEWQPPAKEFGIGYQRQQEQKKQQQRNNNNSKRAAKRERKRKEREENAAQGEEGERPAKRKRPSKKRAKKAQNEPITQPEALEAQPVDGASQAQSAAQATATGGIAFSVTPEEAARRLQVARSLLSESGVNPDSLSADQMNIFSNQSPELQRDSVTMLAKYGAERLQIIHPSNKDKSASSNTPVQTTQTTTSGPMTTKELAPESPKSGRKRQATAKASAEATGTPSKSAKKMGRSRLACLACKSRKVKCPKERPACSECAAHNQSCEYPPQPPRNNKKRKSEAVVIDEDEDEEVENYHEHEDESEVQRPPQPETSFYDGTQHTDLSLTDMSYSNSMPVSDMLTPRAEHLHQDGIDANYFPSSGLVLPQPPAAPQPPSHNPGLALPQPPRQDHEPPRMTSPQQKRSKANAASPARRNVPTGLPVAETNVNANINNTTMNAAAAAAHPTAGSWVAADAQQLNNNSAMSAGLAQQTVRNQQRSRQSKTRVPTDSPQIHDSTPQPTNNVQHTRQQAPQVQQSPRMLAARQTQAQTSPLQTSHQRADSRQSQRGQSRTPNADQNAARGYQPPAQAKNDPVPPPSHGNFGRHSSGDTPASNSNNRDAYESYSWQQSSAPATNSYPAYDYGRSTSSSMSLSNPSTAAPSYNPGSTSNQYIGSRSRSSRDQDRNAGFGNTSSYQQNASNPAPLQNFDLRRSSQKGVSSGSANKQGYSHYGSHQAHEQQMGQPGWNSFNYSGGSQFGSSSGPGWM